MRNQTTQADQGRDKRTAGFSLVELLIVVAVILVIAAIAIPNFIRSKMRANEAAAVEDLRTIITGENVYNSTYGQYSPDLPSLGGTAAAPSASSAEVIDEVLATQPRSGYAFSYSVTSTDANGNALAYSVNADPLVPGSTGDRHFYADETGVIRQNGTSTAGPLDTPLQ